MIPALIAEPFKKNRDQIGYMFRLGHPLQCTSWYTQRSYARGTRERRLLGTERITELWVPGTCVRHDTE